MDRRDNLAEIGIGIIGLGRAALGFHYKLPFVNRR